MEKKKIIINYEKEGGGLRVDTTSYFKVLSFYQEEV